MDINLESYLNGRVGRINEALLFLLREMTENQVPTRIQEAMAYSLMAGGKRIRPVLCIAAAEALGAPSIDNIEDYNANIWLAACALEAIHTYSLIHDDLPAMDDDQLRRGKATCHVAFGEATAILAGDALLTVAFEWLSSMKAETKTQAVAQIDIIHRISKAAGYSGMIEGQMRDLTAENVKLAPDELERMHRLKTGALIQSAIYTGARLAEGNAEQIHRLDQFAQFIGLAFQISDDILNVEGNPDEMGKAVGTDSQRNKNTYPSILGLEESKALGQKIINNALKMLDGFDSRSDPLRVIASYIIERTC